MNDVGKIQIQHFDRHQVPERWSVLAPLVLLGIALLVRLMDIFVLRLDERLGEIILSKSLGFALVVGYTWWVGQRVTAIGLHSCNLGLALAIGTSVTVAAFIIAGIAHFLNNTVLFSSATANPGNAD